MPARTPGSAPADRTWGSTRPIEPTQPQEADVTDPAPAPRYLDDRIAHWAATKPDAEAMSYLGRTWTWMQWNDRVRRLAGALTQRGIGRGDVVAFLDKNHPAGVELTLAAASIGAATVVVNFRLAADELVYVLNDSEAKLLIVGAEFAPTVAEVADRIPGLHTIIAVTPDGADGDEYEQLLSASTPVAVSDQRDPHDTVLVMYSSGTTGRPKGVEITHANLLAHIRYSHEGWEFDEGDKCMVSMPLFHVGGSSYVQTPISDGVPAVMTRDVDGAALAGAILAGANRAFLVPAVLAKVLESGPDAVALFGALKTFSYGASPMPLPLLRAALEAWPNTDFIQVYGLTEVCGVITHLGPEDHRDTEHPERLVSARGLLAERMPDTDPNAFLRVLEQFDQQAVHTTLGESADMDVFRRQFDLPDLEMNYKPGLRFREMTPCYEQSDEPTQVWMARNFLNGGARTASIRD